MNYQFFLNSKQLAAVYLWLVETRNDSRPRFEVRLNYSKLKYRLETISLAYLAYAAIRQLYWLPRTTAKDVLM
jgi:hypothetical protein